MYWNQGGTIAGRYATAININMRCIEMQAERLLQNPLARLTLTWDVLKCIYATPYTWTKGLTLTWDVLKWYN